MMLVSQLGSARWCAASRLSVSYQHNFFCIIVYCVCLYMYYSYVCMMLQALGEEDGNKEKEVADGVRLVESTVPTTTKDSTDLLHLPDAPTTPIFPAVPTHEPVIAIVEDDHVNKTDEEDNHRVAA